MKNESHTRYSASSIERIKEWKISQIERDKVKTYLEAYISGKITQRIGNNKDALIERLTQLLRTALENLKQPVTEKEVETFFDNLVIKQKIKSFSPKTKKYNNKPYSAKTQVEIISALKKYLTWRYNDLKLITPLNIRIGKKEKDIESLTLGEVEKLYKGCKSEEERYLISGLFSSGGRAEEFMSIRLCDITLPEKDEFIKVVIRNDTSKTLGRTISLYYSKTLECFPEYIKQRREAGCKPTDFIFAQSYSFIQRFISSLGKRVLNKRVHAHMFRHASADWLASRLNRQQMCIFYGWRFSSNMPDKYIQRQNVEMKDVDEKMVSSNYQELKDKVAKQEYDAKLKNEDIETVREENKKLAQGYVDILNALKRQGINIKDNK